MLHRTAAILIDMQPYTLPICYLGAGGQNPRIYWSDWHLGVGAGEYIHTAPIIHVSSQGSLSKRKERGSLLEQGFFTFIIETPAVKHLLFNN
jgi:hypothetical protein